MARGRGFDRRVQVRLLVLSGAVLLAVTSEMLPSGLLSVMADDLGASPSAVGPVISAYAVVVAVAAVPLTILTARLPRRRLLLGCVVGFGASNVAMAASTSVPALIAARTLGGLTHAVLFSVVTAFAARLVPDRLMGRAVSLVLGGSSAAFVLGVPLGTSVGSLLGWRTAFLGLAVAGGLLALAARVALPALPALHAPAGASEVRPPRAVSGLAMITGFVLLVMLGHATVYTYVSAILLDAGLATAAVGPALLAFGAAGLVGIWVSAHLADRRRRGGLLGFTALLLLALLLLAAATGRGWRTVLVLPLWGAAYAGIPGFFMSAAVRTGCLAPDTCAAVVNAASNVGIALGAIGGGQIITHAGLDTLPLLAALPVALAFAVIAVQHRPPNPQHEPIPSRTRFS